MARFNFISKCAHPRICKRLMAEFIERATTLTYEYDTRTIGFDENGKPCLIGDENPVEIIREIKMKHIKNHNFSANIDPDDDENMVFSYNYESLMDNDQKYFNRVFYFKNRSFMGFSSLTLVLLHELGHYETYEQIPNGYSREVAINTIYKVCTDKKGNHDVIKANLMYFSLPDEWLATQWAANWLADAENRKTAKAFEKAFFKAWRG